LPSGLGHHTETRHILVVFAIHMNALHKDRTTRL